MAFNLPEHYIGGIAPQKDTYANWVSANPTLGVDYGGISYAELQLATDSPVGDILIWGNAQTFTEAYAARQFMPADGSFVPNNLNLTAGTYNDQDVTSKNRITINSLSGDVTLNGFSGGIDGQMVHIIKTSGANNLIINHNNGSGDQKFLTQTNGNITLAYYAHVLAYCNGAYWFINGQ